MPEQDGFYLKLLDSISDGVYFTDTERRITYWSKGAERMTGFLKEEVLGRRCMDEILMHVDGQGNLLCRNGCPLTLTMTDRQPREQEVFLRTREGHRIPVRVKASAVLGPSGEVLGAVEVFSDNSDKVRIQEHLEELARLALLDPLTGMANRRFMEMHLEGRFQEYLRNRWRFGLLFIDVDRFKAINDFHGHETGDRILRMVGGTLQANSRSFDHVGRWGGDEFLAVIANTAGKRLAEVAERFRILAERSCLPEEGISVTISLGGTEVRPEDTVETLLQRADRNLYVAKRLGRNRVCLEISAPQDTNQVGA